MQMNIVCSSFRKYISVQWRRSLATTSNPQSGILVRDFIQKHYLDPRRNIRYKEYPENPPMPLDFSNILTKGEYKRILAKRYHTYEDIWQTPIELFSPFYSIMIYNYMISKHPILVPLHIYDFNGANGTNAFNILTHMAKRSPELYNKCEYTIIEPNSYLCERQEQKLSLFKDHVHIINNDISSSSFSLPIWSESCFIIGCEYIDRLTHDKVRIKHDLKGMDKYRECHIYNKNGRYIEQYERIQDPVIQSYLRIYDEYRTSIISSIQKDSEVGVKHVMKRFKKRFQTFNSQDIYHDQIKDIHNTDIFINTGLYMFVDKMKTFLPRNHFILNDFDILPPPDLSSSVPQDHSLDALYAPLVTYTDTKGDLIDMGSYLYTDKQYDLFFPTDFALLDQVYRSQNVREPTILKNADFFKSNIKTYITKTILGYNPLLKDYMNSSFFLS
ncbi:hypothetical protein WA158_002821 [Blastocystis sp. Blastoise]